MSRQAILTPDAALHWLRDFTESPERATPLELIATARRHLSHVHPTDDRWGQLESCVQLLRAAGRLS
ncbi:hypothetical protein GCM10027047_01290 [Rhodococcus aerolatus]